MENKSVVLRVSLPTPSLSLPSVPRVIAAGYMLQAGSPKQRNVDHVEPAQDAMDDRPEDRVVVGIGDRDGERRAKTHAVFRALDPNPVLSIFVHGDPSDAQGVGRVSAA
jgi:hypothetical protein